MPVEKWRGGERLGERLGFPVLDEASSGKALALFMHNGKRSPVMTT